MARVLDAICFSSPLYSVLAVEMRSLENCGGLLASDACESILDCLRVAWLSRVLGFSHERRRSRSECNREAERSDAERVDDPRLNATNAVVFVCPKGREVDLSGGPFAWASSVDGKLRSERLAVAGLLLLTIHYTRWEFSTSGNFPHVRIFRKWEFSTHGNVPQGNIERDATSSPGCRV